MSIMTISGVPVTIHGLDAATDERYRQLIRRTLLQLPTAHLQKLPPISFGNRPPRGGGGAAHAGMASGPFIRINVTSFQSRWNRGQHHFTSLHEVGHVIDWSYNCMPKIHVADQKGYQALLRHPHRGATQGPSEHYADAYADYFNNGRSTPNPRTWPARMNAVVNSAAFGFFNNMISDLARL